MPAQAGIHVFVETSNLQHALNRFRPSAAEKKAVDTGLRRHDGAWTGSKFRFCLRVMPAQAGIHVFINTSNSQRALNRFRHSAAEKKAVDTGLRRHDDPRTASNCAIAPGVMPAQAGIHVFVNTSNSQRALNRFRHSAAEKKTWIPACAGMTTLGQASNCAIAPRVMPAQAGIHVFVNTSNSHMR